MDLSNLTPARGSLHKKRRLGRGQGSGLGGTSTRGHKGQKSRSGYSKRFGFEGGQMPLQRRVPKYGFRNRNRKEYRGINLDTLQHFSEVKKLKKIDPANLVENGLASKSDLIKILGRGELKSKLHIAAHAFSASALKAIEAAGGKTEIIDRYKRSENKTEPARKDSEMPKK